MLLHFTEFQRPACAVSRVGHQSCHRLLNRSGANVEAHLLRHGCGLRARQRFRDFLNASDRGLNALKRTHISLEMQMTRTVQ